MSDPVRPVVLLRAYFGLDDLMRESVDRVHDFTAISFRQASNAQDFAPTQTKADVLDDVWVRLCPQLLSP